MVDRSPLSAVPKVSTARRPASVVPWKSIYGAVLVFGDRAIMLGNALADEVYPEPALTQLAPTPMRAVSARGQPERVSRSSRTERVATRANIRSTIPKAMAGRLERIAHSGNGKDKSYAFAACN